MKQTEQNSARRGDYMSIKGIDVSAYNGTGVPTVVDRSVFYKDYTKEESKPVKNGGNQSEQITGVYKPWSLLCQ